MTPSEEVVRRRRGSGEVERLIIDSALAVFAEKGYAGATTREIAARAAVHEPTVYRRFGSKAKLFEATVLAPFNELTTSYLDTYQPQPDPSASTRDLATGFLEPFYDLLCERRGLLLALLAAAQFDEGFSDSETLRLTGLAHLVQRLERQLETEVARRSLRGIDVAAAIRAVIAMVIGVALFGTWLQPDGDDIGRERLLAEMAKLSIDGITRESDREVPGDSIEPHALEALLDLVTESERRAVRAEVELSVARGGIRR